MKKQIKVAYFPSDATKDIVLGSNGKSLDNYCIKCNTEEDLSTGNYILDGTFLIEDSLQTLLQEEAILKVLLDYGEEVFRISKVTVGTRYIDIVARQITIAEELTLWLEDVRPTKMSGASASSYLTANATGTKEIQVISDISAISTAYYMRMNLYEALHDCDQSFRNRWGGEVLRRAYIENINARIGTDRGLTIREGKNLVGFECSSNIENLVTRARGQGFDGILGNYIDSPLINNYNRVYTTIIKYEDIKVKDENNEDDDEGYDTLEEAQVELDRRIQAEYDKNCIDKVKASYEINFIQLEKTEEYKDYIVAERVYLGDSVKVYIPKLKVDIKVRAMVKRYDVLSQRTMEIKLSNFIEPESLSMKQIIDKLESMDSTESILQKATENATTLIKAGLKNSHVTIKENEIIIGDTKDINTMTNVWRYNKNGLGFSSTGYFGSFDTAITMDGSIVGKFITALEINGEQITAGTIKSKNGKTFINMENGTFDLAGRVKFDGDKFDIDIGEIGGANLLTDSNFEMGITSCEGISVGTEARMGVPPTYCLPLLKGDKCMYIRNPDGDAYAITNLRAYMRPNTLHTITYWYKCAGAITGGSSFGYINGGPYTFPINPPNLIGDNQWHRVTIPYTSSADPNVTHIQLRFGYASVGDSWMVVNCVQVEEGGIASSWTPNADELKTSCFEVTNLHARFTGQGGSYTEFNPNSTGLKYHKNSADGGKDYHYLLYRGSVSNIESQDALRIYFPEEFRGKDYQVGWWAGNVFPKNATDLLYSANVEFVDENRNEAWIGLRASVMVRNPATESSPFWRGKMNIMYMVIA
ncbi:phage tail protein [Clostridium estertheticum]|uniref:phage tail spike protein n=1 Tax=Clostridium estertheticum TaxID=238834 RepID=UPI0013EE7EB6|nr:phage tail spike protein [Clostridium estertheticum]MBZ9608627.1 phage tail protein [Clostridium estertheticum]